MQIPPPSQPVSVDGKYQVVRLLGVGGMGAVYEARHLGTGRRVAVKVIAGDVSVSDPDILRRFQREAMATGAVETQHIAHVLDAGIDGETGSPYMVLEYLQGEDVQQTIRRLGPLAPDLALRIALQACLGLQNAHDAEIVHRDIKPANLFLARRDAGEIIVKLVDFGVAKIRKSPLATLEGADLTRTGAMLGSPLYMSPEQARGRKSVDARSDIWSLGVVLYEALAGVTPHAHLSSLGDLIFAICGEPARPVQDRAPWVGPEIAAIVHRALMIDPDGRYQSASEMGDAIRSVLRGGTSIDEVMLVPIGPTMRGTVALRYAAHANTAPASQSVPTNENAHVDTTGGVAPSQVTAPPPRKRRALPLVLGTVIVIGSAATLVVRERAKENAHVDRASSGITENAIAIDAAPSASTAPTTTATNDPSVRTVQLAIAPPAASVEIDGVPTPMREGAVSLSGPLGSTHRVRVSQAKREIIVAVAVTENGAFPPKLELSAPAASKKGGGASSPVTPSTPAGGSPQANAQAPGTSPATTGTTPKPPTVSRDFN